MCFVLVPVESLRDIVIAPWLSTKIRTFDGFSVPMVNVRSFSSQIAFEIERRTRFTATQRSFVGVSTNYARRPTGKDISGRVPTARYMRHLITCLYSVESTGSPLNFERESCPSIGVTTGVELSIPILSSTFSA